MWGQSAIAVNGALFWVVAGLAIVLLNAATSLRAKAAAFTLINGIFLSLLLRSAIIYPLCGIVALFFALRAMPNRRVGVLIVSASAAVVLTLFVINKLHAVYPTLQPYGRVLSLIGFSFVALRCVEVIRAVATERTPPPQLPQLFNYLVPFHMLAAGPILAYEDYVKEPFSDPDLTVDRVLDGASLIARGLFNKFVVCYFIKQVFLTGFSATGLYFYLELLIFTYWTYLDFSSYSIVALGIGKLSGISTPINFNHPLLSRNVIDFWDRWHISLSHMVRRNVFTPIQITLMRRSRKPHPLAFASFATAVSFVLVGAWHGLALGWIIWGSLHALGLIGVRLYMVFLQRKLSPAQLVAYRSSVPVRVVATCLTYTYVAMAFAPVALLTNVSQ